MKPVDSIAVLSGTAAGSALAESTEQVIASAAAAVAVYLLRLFAAWIKSKLSSRHD